MELYIGSIFCVICVYQTLSCLIKILMQIVEACEKKDGENSIFKNIRDSICFAIPVYRLQAQSRLSERISPRRGA